MLTGTIKFFNEDRGFGFIRPDDGSDDTVVHISAIKRAGLSSVRDGQKVTYEIVQDRWSGRSCADNIKVL